MYRLFPFVTQLPAVDLDSEVPVNPGHFWGVQYEVMVKFG